MKKICIITGSRAEWGLLYPLACQVRKESKTFKLQIIACGAHLSTAYGMTCNEIAEDGFEIDRKVIVPVTDDTKEGIVNAVSVGLAGFVEPLKTLGPDMVFLLGDRFELFSAAAACFFLKIPIAHIHGGELTEGSLDNTIRHCITKMAQLHFVSTEVYRKRVIQMGEEPSRVFNVGAMAIDNIKNTKLLGKKEFEKEMGFKLGRRNVLVTFNPPTAEDESRCEKQADNLLKALSGLEDTKIIFTKSNPDMYSQRLSAKFGDYISRHSENCVSFVSMGRVRYLSALGLVDIVAGNSSSAIIEVPPFGIPAINIGDRQKGRIKAESVIDAGGDYVSIKEAFARAFSEDFRKLCKKGVSLHGDGTASKRIVDILKKTNITSAKKVFYDIGFDINDCESVKR